MFKPFHRVICAVPRLPIHRYINQPTQFSSIMAEPSTKRLKSDVTIGTHSGHFHADEALAVYILRLLPTYRDAKLVRTRSKDTLSTLHTVVDVGAEYDPSTNRYDHHQPSFTTTFPDRPTKLSSAGLVYMHFGKAVISQALSATRDEPVTEDNPDVALLFPKIYEGFIEPLDAHDNGISSYDPKLVAEAGLEKRFKTGGFTLGAMVSRMNSNWNEPASTDQEVAQAVEDKRFEAASERIGQEFSRELDYWCQAWIPASHLVTTAFQSRTKFDSEGRVMVLEKSAPWGGYLVALEEESGKEGNVLYVVYPEKPFPGSSWRVQCVPTAQGSFESRKPLPEAWGGARDEALDEVSGISGCVFVHASRFIGGNKTFEGAMEMVKKALEM